MSKTRCRNMLILLSVFLIWGGTASDVHSQNAFPPAGNVGVGTATPGAPLHVVTPAPGTGIRIEDGATGRRYSLVVQPDGKFTIDETGVANRVVIEPSAGHVGLGTFFPREPLHIISNSPGMGIRLEESTSGKRYSIVVQPDGKFTLDESGVANRMVIEPNAGNVGFGTLFPGEPLHVISRSAGLGIRLEEATSGKRFSFVVQPDGKFTIDETGVANRIVVDTAGNVGIGTINPASKLHVAGNARITGDLTTDGNIAAKYQDVAEWVHTTASLPAGTVVMIDPAENNGVIGTFNPYDTRVAGVVSAQPGLLLGEAGVDKVKVAHMGRVKVKVDAQYGAIKTGDLLVSSATAGHAMRSTPMDISGFSMHRPGTILGKALEPLKEGQGEILVLLTLQ